MATRHDHSHSQNRYAVIPTTEKLNTNPNFAGRRVTIAFLDSGFYPHPDFIDRVVAFNDVTGADRDIRRITKPAGHHWHGTQTVVSCAGDGNLSDGIYRGLAHKARLVLVKVSDDGRIADTSIEAGLRWVIEHREKFDIRILNMSLGGDDDLPTHESRISQLTEKLVADGVVVTVAAGNSAESRSIPPANSPSVITVGGYSDENQFASDNFELYHSSFGETADGLVKPEILAPAMYVAAPILPGTEDYDRAEAVSQIANAPDYQFLQIASDQWQKIGLPGRMPQNDISFARHIVEQEIKRRKIIATHYQHVDGTSFAAPIAASVAAQMIEANPQITPAAVKNILASTAVKLAGKHALRQGFGVLNAAAAVEKASAEQHALNGADFFPPRSHGGRMIFRYHDDDAHEVDLCGDFNDWQQGETEMSIGADGIWSASIACPGPGKYGYKFFVDGSRWTEDPSHGFKEDDGLGGFNSIFLIG